MLQLLKKEKREKILKEYTQFAMKKKIHKKEKKSRESRIFHSVTKPNVKNNSLVPGDTPEIGTTANLYTAGEKMNFNATELFAAGWCVHLQYSKILEYSDRALLFK